MLIALTDGSALIAVTSCPFRCLCDLFFAFYLVVGPVLLLELIFEPRHSFAVIDALPLFPFRISLPSPNLRNVAWLAIRVAPVSAILVPMKSVGGEPLLATQAGFRSRVSH
jgi:hypothetical protein